MKKCSALYRLQTDGNSGELVTFVSVYAHQVGQPQKEDEFYDELYRFIGKLKYVVLGEMNGHVGRDVDVFEGVHGGNGF